MTLKPGTYVVRMGVWGNGGETSSRPLDYILITGKADGGSAVEAIEAARDNNRYSIDGVRVAEPTQPGLYIHNGKKVIVK